MDNVSELKNLWKTIISIAGEAAGYLRDLREQREDLWTIVKKQELYRDVARRIDIVAEEYILDLIKHNQLDAMIISEESGCIKLCSKPQYIFVIDPLDGSVNYLLGLPWCSVSIAVAPFFNEGKTKLRDIVVGAIASISEGKIYSFIKEKGTFIGFQSVKKTNPQVKLLLGYSNTMKWCKIVNVIRKIHEGKIAVRNLGCASLEIVYVGIGMAKAFIDLRAKLRNVDIAAAIGFIKEHNVPYTSLHMDVDELPIDKLEKIPSLIVAEDNETLNIIKQLSEINHSINTG